MADVVPGSTSTLVPASALAAVATHRLAPNGVRFASFGDTGILPPDLERVVFAVPLPVAAALADRIFYFVPLALPDVRGGASEGTLIAPAYTFDLIDEAVCHRNATIPDSPDSAGHEGVFISARLLRDQFALAFEFFINVAHAFTTHAGIPESFATLAWTQALADIRGETSQDAYESRNLALADRAHPNEKARLEFVEDAFADALAIYQLALAVDFDYSELREREYPLLAPTALAERLRLIAHLFPPNPTYEFQIRYRRRA